ncbi:hypothetical protein FHT85_000064 [Rhizobium sp. BK312]|jgi:hypothetical protein|uniref:Uncharacterized protein n=1 Tax=Rhizobium miluonense TaxID=411945 RepID=A0ABU1STZ4_9HYPH|nr:hypothetical protein [Rhizobium sp. BK312]MDR6901903.1 hypothetical protein [Rhizobium miluonense]
MKRAVPGDSGNGSEAPAWTEIRGRDRASDFTADARPPAIWYWGAYFKLPTATARPSWILTQRAG